MNIDLNYEQLANLTEKLDSDNKLITELTMEIIMKIRGLDDNKWLSFEKKKIDNQLIPFIDEVEKNMFNRLDECVKHLKGALAKYDAVEKDIKKASAYVADNNISF